MISKVIPPQNVSFSSTCKEVLDGKEVSVLYAHGVREYGYQAMAFDFELQQDLRPTKSRACFYCILSFHPTENPSDETLIEIGDEFLECIGIIETQYVIVKHVDEGQVSLHIIANMVDFYGKVIKDSFIWLKGEKAARMLSKQYGCRLG